MTTLETSVDIPLTELQLRVFDYVACSKERVRDPKTGKKVAYYDRIQERFGLSTEEASLTINRLIDFGVVEMVSAPNDLPFKALYVTELGNGYRRC